MAMTHLFQVPATLLKSVVRVAGARGLPAGLAIVVASAIAACGGESALFPRDGATDVSVAGVGGHGQGGMDDGGEAGTGGTAGTDAGSDLASGDAAMDQILDQVLGATCTNDSGCSPSQFCSAGACVPRFGNLAGNGDVEIGTTAGWYGTFGGGGSLLVSDTTAAGFAHAGMYSVQNAFRTQLFHGPAYRLPTGPGKYTISAWAFQKDDPTVGLSFQVAINCATAIQYLAPTGAAVSQNVWTRFSATLDTTAVSPTPPGDCSATGTTAGGVKLARIFVNQAADGTPVQYPDLFMDDVVVQVTDGHNLVGNANFEGGFTDGWTGGGATVTLSTTVAKTGTHSLLVSGRTIAAAGPHYAMPIGAAKYSVVFQGLHAGISPHGLVLRSTYTCSGGSPIISSPIATGAAVAANTWTQLSGTVSLPPADAPAGCKLTDASVYMEQAETGTCGGAVECPDLYVDDVSIVIPP